MLAPVFDQASDIVHEEYPVSKHWEDFLFISFSKHLDGEENKAIYVYNPYL